MLSRGIRHCEAEMSRDRQAGGGEDVHAALVAALLEDILGGRDVREEGEADG